MPTNIFNGSDSYVGFINAASNEDVVVIISRAGGDSKKLSASFLVSDFQIGFQRGVALQTFLNVKGRVAMLGLPSGTIALAGLLGSADDFEEFLSSDVENDACQPLVITITASNGFTACKKDGSTDTSSKPCKFVCSGALVQSVNTTGRVDQNGIMVITANVQMQFTKMQLVKI